MKDIEVQNLISKALNVAASSKSQKWGFKRILVLQFTTPLWQASIHLCRHGIQECYFPPPRLTPFHSIHSTRYHWYSSYMVSRNCACPRSVCGYTCISSNLIPAKCNWCLKHQIFISPKFLLVQYLKIFPLPHHHRSYTISYMYYTIWTCI